MRTIDHRYGRSFTFQWHLTVECSYTCRHCYTRDPITFELEKTPPSREKLFSILASLDRFFSDLENTCGNPVSRNVVLTGGDPLLHPAFSDLVMSLTDRGYHIGLLGCPETFTEEMTAFLAQTAVKSVQFSLDGLEETHDAFRASPGSFSRTIEKALALQDLFNVNIMFTVCPENMHELIPLLAVLDGKGMQRVDFARVSYLGGASQMESMQPRRYRALLEEVFRFEEQLEKKKSRLRIGKKDNLWKLLYFEKGLLQPPQGDRVVSGCPCGFVSLAILSDGSVFACRRFSSRIGRVPDDDLFRLYRESETLESLRNPLAYEGCSICRLKTICRGCPAVGASFYGQLHRRDPACWRIVMPATSKQHRHDAALLYSEKGSTTTSSPYCCPLFRSSVYTRAQRAVCAAASMRASQ